MDSNTSSASPTPSASQSATVRRPTLELPSSGQVSARTGQQMGKYRLVQLLAQGGFAEVYLGKHIYLNTQAAIKILYAQLTTEELGSFGEEARIVASLRHPHIINVLDFDVQNGMPFIVMDYAPNGTLRQRHQKKTILSEATILPYVAQIANALQYAHNRRLVHRDVKPENMLIGYEDEILLSDFGIAVVFQTSRAEMEHQVVGTVAYMSPEQFKGQASPASDQYALAVVIYEWLCGRWPFQGSITEIMAQHVNADPPSLRIYNPNVSSTLEQLVLKALSKQPEQRYPTILDFAHAFEAACPQKLLILHEPTLMKKEHSSFESHNAETVRAFSSEGCVLEVASSKKRVDRELHYSRRTLLLGLAGLTTLGLAGSGLVWLAQASQHTRPGPSTSTATPSPISIGTQLLVYHGHTDAVSAVAWSPPEETYIVSASKDKSVRVWNVSSGADKISYTGHSDVVNTVAWSYDGQHIASAGNDKTVQVWSPNSGANNAVVTYQNHGDIVNSVSWSPNAQTQYIASASNDKTVRIWKSQDGSDIITYTEHTDAVRAVAWAPSDGKYIASASADHTVRVWPAPPNPGDPAAGSNPTAVVVFQSHSAEVRAIAWSPNSQYIASAGVDNIVFIWYAVTGGNPLITYRGHTAAVNAVSWSPDGTLIASASDDGTVHIWKASDGSHLYSYPGHSIGTVNAVYSAIWSYDGTAIASTSADKTVQIWHT